MADGSELLLGEWDRSLDDRFRISLPSELTDVLAGGQAECTIAKEQPGCVSLWNSVLVMPVVEFNSCDIRIIRITS